MLPTAFKAVNEQHNAESQAITIAARKSAPNELKLGRSLVPEARVALQPKVNVRRSERKRY